MVDLVVSLGRGQRELVVGDRKTGKTSFLQQVVLAQAGLGTYLEKTGEVGYVTQSLHSIIRVSGLPQAKPHETSITLSVGSKARVIFNTPRPLIVSASPFKNLSLSRFSSLKAFWMPSELLTRKQYLI